VAREIKALAPSAYSWARDEKGSNEIFYEKILRRAVRSPDPWVHLRGRWIVRRLASDCQVIDLDSWPRERDESRLLSEMGWETANIHLGTKKAVKTVLRDLKKRPVTWLRKAAETMLKVTLNDWEDWRAP